jgi:trehalose 6-phosphate phosphatase
MQHLFTPAGEVALAATLLRRPLLAFDFDGTLAPIVARPDDARISQAVSARLKSLAAQLPVAIVTGRAVADVRGRLGFEPRFIVGSHGAEDGLDASAAAARAGALNPVRDLLRARGADLAAVGCPGGGQRASRLPCTTGWRARRSRAPMALIQELLAQPGLSLHSLCRKDGGQRHGSRSA